MATSNDLKNQNNQEQMKALEKERRDNAVAQRKSAREAGVKSKLAAIKGVVDKAKAGVQDLKDKIANAVASGKGALDKMNSKLTSLIKTPITIPGNSHFTDLLNSALAAGQSALGNALNSALTSVIASVGNIAQSLANQIVGMLMSNVFVPEIVFLAAVKVADKIGDIKSHQSYLRWCAIDHDQAMVLEYFDGETGVRYTAGRGAWSEVCLRAKKHGSIHVIEYVIGRLNAELQELSRVGDTNKAIQSSILKTKTAMHMCLKHLIVGSYTHLEVGQPKNIARTIMNASSTIVSKVTGGKIVTVAGVISEYGLHPSALGDTDKEFGKEALIRLTDIDFLAPFTKFEKTERTKEIESAVEQAHKDAVVRVEYLQGSKYKHIDESKMKKYISPRNFNIKDIYLYLTETTIHGQYAMRNAKLHERLRYPISDVFRSEWENLKAQTGMYSSVQDGDAVYIVCKKFEDLIFNPDKTVFMNVATIMGESKIPESLAPVPQPYVPPALNSPGSGSGGSGSVGSGSVNVTPVTEYTPGNFYPAGSFFMYNGRLYYVQSDMIATLPFDPSLFIDLGEFDGDWSIYEFRSGYHYMPGDLIYVNGVLYIVESEFVSGDTFDPNQPGLISMGSISGGGAPNTGDNGDGNPYEPPAPPQRQPWNDVDIDDPNERNRVIAKVYGLKDAGWIWWIDEGFTLPQ